MHHLTVTPCNSTTMKLPLPTPTELETANSDIVENIQTISAVTEEVSAHANETFEACQVNSELVDSVSGIVSDISDKATGLHAAE